MRRGRSLKLLACLLRRPHWSKPFSHPCLQRRQRKGKPSEAGSGWDWLRLLELWSEAGFDPDSFWRQTPRTLKAIMAGYSARVKWAHRERMSAAWHGAAFERSKKMPKLIEVLGDEAKTKQRSNNQMLQMLRSITKQRGGLKIVKVA